MAQPRLLEQYRERLRVKHYSLRTEDAYLHLPEPYPTPASSACLSA
jgi:hypothetical protein